MPLRPSQEDEHLPLLARRRSRASTQPVSRLVASPLPHDVVGAGERRVGGGVLADQGGGVGFFMEYVEPDSVVLMRDGAGVQAECRCPRATCSFVASTRRWRRRRRRVSRRRAAVADAVDRGLPGQRGGGRAADDEAGAPRAGRAGPARAVVARAAVAADARAMSDQAAWRAAGRPRCPSTWPRLVGDDDEVAADDRQAAVGALVGDVLQPLRRTHGPGEEPVVPTDREPGVVTGDQAAGGGAGLGAGVAGRRGRLRDDAEGLTASTVAARTVARTPPRTSLCTDTLQGTVDRVGSTHEVRVAVRVGGPLRTFAVALPPGQRAGCLSFVRCTKMVRRSLHRDALGEVARLVDVVAELERRVVGEQLQRHGQQDRVQLDLVAGHVDAHRRHARPGRRPGA